MKNNKIGLYNTLFLNLIHKILNAELIFIKKDNT